MMATESRAEPQPIEVEVWRLGPEGHLVTSVVAQHADWLAEQDPEAIYFYAELGATAALKNTGDTMQKVYDALAAIGLSQNQIINAVNGMQNAGIYFRESAL